MRTKRENLEKNFNRISQGNEYNVMSKLVSILIPVYNAQKWIGYTIKSALEQTWPNKEIIIVDDGSSDKTLVIAKQFESKFVKVISQRNRGASAARNKAFEHAQGEYIQWLDADDLLDLNKISEQMKIAESGVTSMTLLSGAWGKFHWRCEKARFLPNLLWQDLSPLHWIINKFSFDLWMADSVWLVSRSLTEKAGSWDERLSFDDDGEYFCRVVATSDGVKFVPEARCYYRTWGFSQLNRGGSEKALKSLVLSLTLCIWHLRSLEDSERTRRASLMLLQSYLPNFYTEKPELLEKMKALASELGEELTAPGLGWKFDVMRRFFGWEAANWTVAAFRRLKLAAAVKMDEVLYRISRSIS